METTQTHPVGLDNLNTEWKHFIARDTAAQTLKIPMYGAIFFIDNQFNTLLIEDNQDGNANWKRIKVPGGVARDEKTNEWLVNSHNLYLETLDEQLKKVHFSNGRLEEIMAYERKSFRPAAMRTAILEFVEETGYYPINIRYVCDGYRYNRNSNEFDLWQAYFHASAVVSPYTGDFENPIKRITQVKTAEAIDKDVVNMRLGIPIEEVEKKLAVKQFRAPAQDAWKVLCMQQADFFQKKGLGHLSKKFSLLTF